MKTLHFISTLLLIIIPLSTYAATEPYNAGFVSGLWYSKVPFFSGETIRIYAAFQNHSGGDIAGTVEFFDNDTSIGQSNFSAINDRLVETWIDWTVSYGSHIISAKIIQAKRSEAGKPSEKIEVLASQSKPETVFADKDSDKDGIGDLIDPTPLPLPPPPVVPATPIVQKKNIPAPTTVPVISGGVGGGNGGDILTTVNNYTSSLLQTVNAQREGIKSNIKDIDDTYKRVDTDHDGLIGLTDFNTLMINWGRKGLNVADYNRDGTVDIIDFNILMVYWS